jgi:hypothetical protein
MPDVRFGYRLKKVEIEKVGPIKKQPYFFQGRNFATKLKEVKTPATPPLRRCFILEFVKFRLNFIQKQCCSFFTIGIYFFWLCTFRSNPPTDSVFIRQGIPVLSAMVDPIHWTAKWLL